MTDAAPVKPSPAAMHVLRDSHPLDLIPYFQRWPPGIWRDAVKTFIWNTAVALLFTGFVLLWTSRFGAGRVLWINFVFANCIGYSIHVLYMIVGAIAYALMPTSRLDERWARVVQMGIIPTAGAIAGFAIAAAALGWSEFGPFYFSGPRIFLMASITLLICGILLAVVLPREQADRARAALATEELRAMAAERETVLAQMKALEAKVEPHFLYNTLAHVTSLIDTDPRQAHAMLDRLIALLRETARTSNGYATLGGQVDLLRAYLEILAMRMGPRLGWSVDVPPELMDAPLPPALLQPLVENAVKHGLEPKIQRGRIDIAARERDGMLELVVADTGAGFRSTAAPLGGSTQLGLSVLKERLATLYGGAASLVLAENRPAGVRVTLRIPRQQA